MKLTLWHDSGPKFLAFSIWEKIIFVQNIFYLFQVKRIMLKHQDYKGYSYRPWDAHRIRMKKYFWENYWVKEGQGQNLELPPPVDAYNEK